MTIQFGGLATGLDTKSIITQLMALEQKPITKLRADQTWLNNRLTAFGQLDTKLKSFTDSITNLGNADTLLKRSVSQNSKDYLTASVTSDALVGTSYQVEVVSLAQVQKSISATGFSSNSSSIFGTGTLKITVGTTSHDIDITADNNSLQGIIRAINKADIGVFAAYINVGSKSSPSYRLVLSGDTVGNEFSLDSTGLTGGIPLGSLDLPGGTNPPVQVATQAHIKVDNFDIYSDSNTITDAIPGTTLNLLQLKEGTTTNLNISQDTNSIKATIQAFAKGYNEVVSFITSQSVIDGKGGGVLNGDSGINALKRHLQSMLTNPYANSGSFKSLSQLGFETQKNGTLTVDDTTLSAAIDTNLNSVVSLLAGDGTTGGLGKQFQDYLKSMTNSSTGMLKGRTDSTNTNIKQINTRITAIQARLEQRQKTMEAQFSAMETLVSGLNAQSTYMTQQMTAITNIMNYGSKS